MPHRFAGGMYAAPTHGPNAVATQKRYHGANDHGGVKTPPYKVNQTPDRPANFQNPSRGARHHNFSFLIFNF